MNSIDQCNGVIDGGLRKDAMPEIENVARSAGGLVQYKFSLLANFIGIRQQHGWVKIALDGSVVADGLPGVIQTRPPINPNHGRPRIGK